MTLNGGGSGAGGSRGGGRERERRRGSTPWGPAPPLHRRSMPVDERDLRAALAPGALAAATAGTGAQAATLEWHEGSSESLSSGGSDSDESVYKVLLLGAPGVGKSALARIFGGVEDGPEAEAAGEGLGLFKGGDMLALGLRATGRGTWIKSGTYHRILKTLSKSCLYLPISWVGKLRGRGPPALGRGRNAQSKRPIPKTTLVGWGWDVPPCQGWQEHSQREFLGESPG